MRREIELVIFDLGRVLVRICDGWQHACEVAGIARPGDIDAEREAKLHDIVCAMEVGEIGLEEFASRCAPLLGIPTEHVIALSNAYPRGAYPGALELLQELNAAGYQTACLSNTNINHWRIMDEQVADYLPLRNLGHKFASHLVRMRKPEERIYAHVEQVTGVAPQRIIFFDDVEENVAAARRRGWNGYRIEIDSDPIAQMRKHLRAHGVAVAP